MITINAWHDYIQKCIYYNKGTFKNNYYEMVEYIIITPFALFLDLIFSPIEIPMFIIGRILEKKYGSE